MLTFHRNLLHFVAAQVPGWTLREAEGEAPPLRRPRPRQDAQSASQDINHHVYLVSDKAPVACDADSVDCNVCTYSLQFESRPWHCFMPRMFIVPFSPSRYPSGWYLKVSNAASVQVTFSNHHLTITISFSAIQSEILTPLSKPEINRYSILW